MQPQLTCSVLIDDAPGATGIDNSFYQYVIQRNLRYEVVAAKG